MRSYGEASEDIKEIESDSNRERMTRLGERLDARRAARREKEWVQGVDTTRRYIQQVAREAEIHRKMGEPVTPQYGYAPHESLKPAFPASVREIRRTPLLKR
jgi:hypothetical protein